MLIKIKAKITNEWVYEVDTEFYGTEDINQILKIEREYAEVNELEFFAASDTDSIIEISQVKE